MTVRLTESRLRQIIREELASLSTRPIREGIDTTRANVVAAKEGYTHYADVEFTAPEEVLARHGEGEDVAEDVYSLIGKDFDGLSERVILIEKGLDTGTARFYGSGAQMDAVAAAFAEKMGLSDASYLVKELPRV